MDAMRCTECGDTRWSITGFGTARPRTCELCGGRLVPERRHPSQGPGQLTRERRDVTWTLRTGRFTRTTQRNR